MGAEHRRGIAFRLHTWNEDHTWNEACIRMEARGPTWNKPSSSSMRPYASDTRDRMRRAASRLVASDRLRTGGAGGWGRWWEVWAG